MAPEQFFSSPTTSSLVVPDNPDWYFGTGPFTIDFWFYFNTLHNWNHLVNIYYNDNNRFWIAHRHDSYTVWHGLWIGLVIGGTRSVYMWDNVHHSLSAGQWYHFALVRYDTTSNVKTFLNGQQTIFNPYDANRVIENFPDLAAPMVIGLSWDDNYGVDGSIDEFRVSNIARWSDNFTPPTEAYGMEPHISGSTEQDGRIIILDESDWSIEVNEDITAGNYYFETTSGSKTVLIRTTTGEAAGYGNVTPQ